MSSNDELWEALTQRAARAQVSGVTANDDDALASADLIEASINPHRSAQAGAGGAGGPGMMPPMMMGGGRGGEAGGATSAGLGARAAEPAGGPLSTRAQAPAAAGVPGEATSIDKSPGGAGGGGGGIGGGGGGGGGGIGGGGGGIGGDGGAPEAAGVEEPAVEPAAAVTPDSEVAGIAITEGETADMGSAVAAAPEPMKPLDGFVANPDEVNALGERWTELSEQMRNLSRQPGAAMGLFENAQRAREQLTQQLDSWREGSVNQFQAVAERLHEAAAQYGQVDDEGVTEMRRTEGLSA